MAAITLTNAGKNLFRDGLAGSNNPLISYVAVGTSNTSPNATDVLLGAESFRKAVTSYTTGTTGQIQVNMYLAQNEAVGTAIAEVGFFGGNTASSTANSGTLVARGLYSHTKTNTESITLQFDITF